MVQDCNGGAQTAWHWPRDTAQTHPLRHHPNQVNVSLPMLHRKTEVASGCVQIMRDLSGPCLSTRDEIFFDNPSHLSWA